MGLIGKANAEKIWNYPTGLSDCGEAGRMGNLKAESVLNPINLQNSYEKSLATPISRRPGSPAWLANERAVYQLQGRSDHAEICNDREGRIQRRPAPV